MSNLDLEKIIFPNDNNTYIIRDAQAHTDLANKANKDGSNIVGPWTMNITGHASQDIASTEKRQPGGVAELDQNGLIITSQLPSSVDEIIEGYYFNNKFYKDEQYTQEITGEASKIYIDLSSNQTYRWSGSTYVEISPSIALGVEHSTAGYGDWTNTAYLHATDANKISAAVASGLYKIAATSEGHIASLTAVTKADITALGIPAQDTTYSQGTGISIDNNNVINHSNSVTAGTAKGDNSKTLTFGGTFTIPSVTYDAQGHITTKGTTTMTMPGNPNTTYTLGTSGNTVTLTPSSGSVQSITVPFATNSTKATQDASGNTITTTYRRLDNNTFDTISVTDLTAGDVVVTGVGRFTNGLYGNLTGNADTATNVGWSGVTGKPSTYPPSPHSHAEIYTVGDYRSSATTPNDYKNMLRFQGLKSKATIDSPSSDMYSYLLGLRGWADNSGGDAWELAFNNSGINVRHGATTTWGSWTKLLDSSNYNDYAPTKTGTGASGTWGISVSGNAATATKATQDGSGNVITSSYTPYKGNLNGTIGSGSPAADMKTYWDNNDNIKTNSVNTAYNNAGQEYAFLLSKGNSNQYGAVIRWGYGTKYFEILRKYGSTWKDSDWVKMDAGYADTAGTATKLGSSNVGSATQPIYLNGGTATACTYTLEKSVPSDAVFTDTKVTQTATGDSYTNWRPLVIGSSNSATEGFTPSTVTDSTFTNAKLSCQPSTGTLKATNFKGSTANLTGTITSSVSTSTHINGARGTNVIINSTAASSGYNMWIKSNSTNGVFNLGYYQGGINLYYISQTKIDAGTNSFDALTRLMTESGDMEVHRNITAAGYIKGNTVYVNSANSGTAGGISLYDSNAPTDYGIAMRSTSNCGKHGYVQGDWATAFCMIGGNTRGWIYRHAGANIASISGEGHAAFNGSVTIGANTTNTSGVRQVYNSTTKSLDFAFVA